jgi:hypothetical protein
VAEAAEAILRTCPGVTMLARLRGYVTNFRSGSLPDVAATH